MFELHPRLAQDCLPVTELPLCRVLLMNDAHYPWFILVPRRESLREIHHLAAADRVLLLQESCALASAMEQVFAPCKLNVAALGNLVPQLHVHHIARFEDDPAWPQPVWGKRPAQAYAAAEAEARIRQVCQALAATAA